MSTDEIPDDEREEQITRLLNAYEKRLREKYPRRLPQSIEEIERSAEEIGEGVKQDIQQEETGSAGTGYDGKKAMCRCGKLSRFKEERSRSIVTLHGVLIMKRAYYWCKACRSGSYPLDKRLPVPRGQISVSVRALACRFTSLLPYAKAARELELVCGIRLSVSTMERISRQVGQDINRAWKARQDAVWEDRYEPSCRPPERMHISMDGVMAHVGGVWREVKLGVCYQPGKDGPTRDTYCATLDPSHEFGKRVKTLSVHAGETLCRNVAVLADGGEWIWQEAAKHYTTRTQILDFFHVTEHLWEVARSRFGPSSEAAADWVSLQKARLIEREHGAGEVIRDVSEWAPNSESGRDIRRRTVRYLLKHEHRMRYHAFREQGHQIASGVMESSCRWVVQQRMKGSGMRWQTTGAEAMLALRTALCSEADGDILAAARSTTLRA